jgi:hypothetical protein
MDDEVARAFLDVVSSGADERVRADVLIGLGPIIDEAGIDYGDDDDELLLDPELGPAVSREMFDTIVREVRGVYEDESQPKLVRRRALEVLVRDPQPWLSSEIRRHFASDDPEWKRTAVFAMGYVTGFEKEIVAVVNAEQGQLLIEGVKAAGHMEVAGAAKRLRDLVNAKGTERDLRLYAIEALPHVDPDSFDILDRLTRSNDEEVAEAAEAALEELSLAESMDDEGWDDEEDDDEEDDDEEDDEEDDQR